MRRFFMIVHFVAVSAAFALYPPLTLAQREPEIRILDIPPYGSTQNLVGEVVNADPATHHVVCYLFLEGVG